MGHLFPDLVRDNLPRHTCPFVLLNGLWCSAQSKASRNNFRPREHPRTECWLD